MLKQSLPKHINTSIDYKSLKRKKDIKLSSDITTNTNNFSTITLKFIFLDSIFFEKPNTYYQSTSKVKPLTTSTNFQYTQYTQFSKLASTRNNTLFEDILNNLRPKAKLNVKDVNEITQRATNTRFFLTAQTKLKSKFKDKTTNISVSIDNNSPNLTTNYNCKGDLEYYEFKQDDAKITINGLKIGFDIDWKLKLYNKSEINETNEANEANEDS